MDVDVPLLAGYVTIPQQSGFTFKPITKKKSPKYCMLFKASCHGRDRLEIGDSETDKTPKIVTLDDCVKITQEPPPANLIHVVSKTGNLTLNPTSEEDLRLWLTALQSVAFKEKAEQTHNTNLMRTTSGAAIEEDNDLYCSSYDGVFVIHLIKTEASQRCNIPEKMYKLSLGTTDLLLVAFEDEKKIITKWPYRFIRKYGYRDGHFTFEAGRKCDTGEGNFSLVHATPQEIFRCMSTKMKSMKKMLHGDPSLNAEEARLSEFVSSMEAGSRSPIPHWPTTPSSDFNINSVSSLTSVRSLLSSAELMNTSNVSTTSSSINLLKHTPNKPPRKTLQEPQQTTPHQEKLPELPKRNAPQTPTGPREYECIKSINDAWRTMGIENVPHTENVKDVSPEDPFSVAVANMQKGTAKRDYLMLDTQTKPGRKLVEITMSQDCTSGGGGGDSSGESEGQEGNYDHLDHFRSKSKNSSTYKTVIPVSPPPSTQLTTSTGSVTLTQFSSPSAAGGGTKEPAAANDDYEIIGQPQPTAIDTNKCRLADDRSSGYGALRPIGLPLPPTPSPSAMLAMKKSPSAGDANKTALFLLESNNNNNFSNSNSEVLLKNSAILLTTTQTSAGANDAATISEKRIEMLANGELVEDVDDVLGHRKFNGLEYAIVSKAKQV